MARVRLPRVLERLPRIVFVLGKGGVGRSTIAAALGTALASHGETILVLEWTVAEAIAPWFGHAAAGVHPVEVSPRLSVANYDLHWALEAYFVDHLRLRRFHRHVIDGAAMRKLIQAAPGVAELLFVGQLWWLSTLAAEEAGLRFDRIVVDAPATGHGASILHLPATLETLGATGLLALETGRVRAMMADPAWTGALLVAEPEELAVEETRELLPRATRDLGRPPLGLIVNRSQKTLGPIDPAVGGRLSANARASFEVLRARVESRRAHEAALRALPIPTLSIDDFTLDHERSAREIVAEAARVLGGRT